eukprot:TRINITY_DN2489_c0_g1_i3.p1 TRINITY_DN2489_c0_g1~~TRINITY_DN2489_c0_g1_i3.p1  ORF type:complete len:399 (+),score=138.68 TRINITY_DN2489_c0_g1_i3:130-1197(+)
MGACISGGVDKEKAARSRALDKKIYRETRALNEEVKILLLGPGESGKSTVFKQMKIIQKSGGFTQDELKQYRFIVFGNCITQMKVLVAAGEKLEIPLAESQNIEVAKRVASLPPGGGSWSAEVGSDIQQLWADSGIQEVYGHRDRDFQLNDSAKYFFDEIDRFKNADYVPTQDDVLRARVRSTGIEEAEFEFENLCFRMLDVGGQRSERRKWIHCFDCVTAVLFCAAISEYDQVLREDESANRMKESLLLFDEVVNSPWFENTAFILFLNKLDLFKEKIKRVPLKNCFPEYTGPAGEEEPARNYIFELFQAKRQVNKTPIFAHFTVAIDTKNIDSVFGAVRSSLMQEVLDTFTYA